MTATRCDVAGELITRLGRHYIKPGRPGGVFASEVGTNDFGVTGSRCDAVYAGFTTTPGRILIGHEVKVSRGDWLHELDRPGKADFWFDNCHAWYVVAAEAGIVRPEELPVGWGLMLPSRRSEVKFTVAVKADVRHDLRPSWLAVRSVMARQDTQHRAAMAQAQADGARDVLAAAINGWKGYPHTPSPPVTELLRRLIALGVAADRERRSRVGRLDARELVDRIVERLEDAGTSWDCDAETIVEAVADHALISRATRELDAELHRRANYAQSLLAGLPGTVLEALARQDEPIEELTGAELGHPTRPRLFPVPASGETT